MNKLHLGAAALACATLTACSAGGPRPTEAQCQDVIRANYPAEDGITVTVTFQAFAMGSPRPFTATYGNDSVGVGHSVQATPVHARYTVLSHYADPKSDDELRTYDAQYMCYRSPTGDEWMASMVSRAPGGESAQYIHKG